jgi:hypothetical protein
VKDRNICADTSAYRAMRGRTQTACGQSASARRIGIAERTPNLRTS